MEQNNVNIAVLLKDCPKGTKLYTSLLPCEEKEQYNCILEEVCPSNYYKITIKVLKGEETIGFLAHGDYSEGGECLLFPSKEVRDWGCFKTKYVHLTGDKQKDEPLFALLNASNTDFDCDYTSEAIAYKDSVTGEAVLLISEYADSPITKDYILSTGTELKLEEEPKFKVGDVVVKQMIDKDRVGFIKEIVGYTAYVEYLRQTVIEALSDLVLAQNGEIAKWNKEVLQPNHLHYSKSKRKIINWLLPFDKVVVRNNAWNTDFFSHYDKDDEEHYHCVGGYWIECLPYNENTAKLIGTTDDYKEE